MKLVQFTRKNGKEVYINPEKVTSLKAYGENRTLIVLDSGTGTMEVVNGDLHHIAAKLQF